MLFNSFEFIFLFLPIVFIVYFILNTKVNQKYAKIWMVLSSLFFYSWWNILYLPLLLGSITFNYFLSRIISSNRNSKVFLIIGILGNVLLLGYFKYMDFFILNVNFLFETSFDMFHIVLPLAISFITFQQIAFLVDTYRKETKEYTFLDYMMFITFFPQLIAGPIVYHKEMMPQFVDEDKRLVNTRNIARGIFIFIVGLFKKVVIADSFAKWANIGFDNSSNLTLIEGWITSLSYTMQLYFDFSAYSDMAIGLALLFNIRLPINFNSPYKSLSIQEFWRRWHMTLNQFLTKYVYIPLGGSKKGTMRTYTNILIIFAVSGIWHGAGWTFVIWGILHGLATCINRLWSISRFNLPPVIAWLITFNFVNVAWVFFRSTSISQAQDILSSMFNISSLVAADTLGQKMVLFQIPVEFFNTSFSMMYIIVTMIVVSFIVVLFAKNTFELSELRFNTFSGALFIAVLVVISLYITFSSFSSSEFIYFNF